MDAKTKKRLIIWLSVGTILAVGGFFTVKHFKAKKAEKKRIEDEVAAAVIVASATSTTPGSATVASATSTTPGSATSGSAIDQPSDVKAFQDWLDSKGYRWVLNKSTGKWTTLNKGVGYGDFGDYTQIQWKTYKNDFLKEIGGSAVSSKVNDADFEIAKAYLLKAWVGNKSSFTTRLNSLNKSFVVKWASEAKQNNAAGSGKNYAFEWAYQIYNISNGDKIYNFNPTSKDMAYGATDEMWFRKSPSKKAEGVKGYNLKDKTIGKVTWYYWNDSEKILFFYIPTKNLGITPEPPYTASSNVVFK